MRAVGAYEAKTRLSELLKRVGQGETITITRHGVPIAELRQPGPKPTGDTAEWIRELKKFRERHTLGEIAVRDLLEEGRK